MMTRKILAALIFALAAAIPPLAAAQSPADYDAYVARIRAEGITELGRTQLMTAIVLRLGHSTLTYAEDEETGRYIPTYQSTTCPVPGADPQATAALREKRTAEMTAELAKLQPLADTDGSGFVSTEEAVAFRELYEFGVLLKKVAARSGQAMGAIGRASGLDEAAVNARLAAFRDLERRAADVGIVLVESANIE